MLDSPAAEKDTSAFLTRLIPTLFEKTRGCSEDLVLRLKEQAGGELPPFYRWFLLNFGQDMGPLSYRDLDFTPETVLSAMGRGVVQPVEGRILIAYNSNEIAPLHLFYDLSSPMRGDCRIYQAFDTNDEEFHLRETLREDLCYGAVIKHGIPAFPCRVKGFLEADGDIMALTQRMLTNYGFESPPIGGDYTGFFLHKDALLSVTTSPDESPDNLLYFRLGAKSPSLARELLGHIAVEGSLSVDIEEWHPPLTLPTALK